MINNLQQYLRTLFPKESNESESWKQNSSEEAKKLVPIINGYNKE